MTLSVFIFCYKRVESGALGKHLREGLGRIKGRRPQSFVAAVSFQNIEKMAAKERILYLWLFLVDVYKKDTCHEFRWVTRGRMRSVGFQ